MADPTPGELGRRLDDRIRDVRDDIDRIDRRVDAKVDAQLYEAKHTALVREVSDLKKEMATMRAERTRADEKLAAMRRWWIGTVVMPLVAVLMAYVLSKGGSA